MAHEDDDEAERIRRDDREWEARRAAATWHGGLAPEAHAAITAAHGAAEAERVDATLRAVDVRRRPEVDVYVAGVAVRMRARRYTDESFAWAPPDERQR